ncbi:hypothetical protein F383_05846 [Gossypium arboreum]|uniref:Uncharacterized protein n=1 Tax=Gossypium arboreum TaxID=29729 RepID=A0A0B0N7L4_GOSAR|nr:hypothetical protein F383_36283 [Gossypium arboreum]KHG11789.1 hypothetical protein F383_05846 [Gossypium arboreum]
MDLARMGNPIKD